MLGCQGLGAPTYGLLTKVRMEFKVRACKVSVPLENSLSCSQPFKVGKCLQDSLWRPPGCLHQPVISLLEKQFVQTSDCTRDVPTMRVFFFFLHQMLTSGNSPTPEKSLVLHQVILEFHKRSAFQNTFLGCFCRKGMTRRGNLLLTGVFKDSANAN